VFSPENSRAFQINESSVVFVNCLPYTVLIMKIINTNKVKDSQLFIMCLHNEKLIFLLFTGVRKIIYIPIMKF
jgi:hypothetical protein